MIDKATPSPAVLYLAQKIIALAAGADLVSFPLTRRQEAQAAALAAELQAAIDEHVAAALQALVGSADHPRPAPEGRVAGDGQAAALRTARPLPRRAPLALRPPRRATLRACDRSTPPSPPSSRSLPSPRPWTPCAPSTRPWTPRTLRSRRSGREMAAVHFEAASSTPPTVHHDGLDDLRAKVHEIETRSAGGQEASAPGLPSVLADNERAARRAALIKAAGLAGEQKDIVRRLEQKVLLDDRTWLDLLFVDACRAELVDGAGLAEPAEGLPPARPPRVPVAMAGAISASSGPFASSPRRATPTS